MPSKTKSDFVCEPFEGCAEYRDPSLRNVTPSG